MLAAGNRSKLSYKIHSVETWIHRRHLGKLAAASARGRKGSRKFALTLPLSLTLEFVRLLLRPFFIFVALMRSVL